MQKHKTLSIAELVRDGTVPVVRFVSAVERQRSSRPPVGEVALMDGLLTDSQVHEVLRVQKGSRRRFIDTAVSLGFVSREQGDSVLEKQLETSGDLVDLICDSDELSRERLSERVQQAERSKSPRGESHPPEWRASQSLAMAIASLTQLKPFSSVVREAIAALDSSETGLGTVARLLEKDPAVSTAVLRLANSAMYRRGRCCDDLLDASSRLGTSALRDLVMGLSVLGLIERTNRLAVSLREHCAAVGALSRSLALAVAPRWREGAFLAGLLHDVGKLLLEQSGEFDYEGLDAAAREKPDRACVRERAELGYDHSIVGELSLRYWQLPEPVAAAVGAHHDPARANDLDDEAAALTALVRLADRLDYAMRDNLHFSAGLRREVEDSGDAHFLLMTPGDLEEIWVDLVAARSEAVALFGSPS